VFHLTLTALVPLVALPCLVRYFYPSPLPHVAVFSNLFYITPEMSLLAFNHGIQPRFMTFLPHYMFHLDKW
jgi:hypothetical protein